MKIHQQSNGSVIVYNEDDTPAATFTSDVSITPKESAELEYVELKDETGSNILIPVESVSETKQVDQAAVPFSGTQDELVELVRQDIINNKVTGDGGGDLSIVEQNTGNTATNTESIDNKLDDLALIKADVKAIKDELEREVRVVTHRYFLNGDSATQSATAEVPAYDSNPQTNHVEGREASITGPYRALSYRFLFPSPNNAQLTINSRTIRRRDGSESKWISVKKGSYAGTVNFTALPDAVVEIAVDIEI